MGEPEPPAPAGHVPVLLDRVLELLAPALDRAGAVLLDATLGLGGHSEALLRAHPGITLVGLDRDRHALRLSAQRLARYAERTHLVHAVYDQLPRVLDELDLTRVDAVLFDLGVSSMQLDLVERGFSYAQDAPLDMRMDDQDPLTAEEVVNSYPVPQLARVLRNYGEERFALRVAQAIGRTAKTDAIDATVLAAFGDRLDLQARPVAAVWRAVTGPFAVFIIHAVALWVWHLPSLYQLTLENDAVHAVRVLRSALHGFVLLETGDGFGMPLDLDESFTRLVQTLHRGIAPS